MALDKKLQEKKCSLDDFKSVTLQVLAYLPAVITNYTYKRGYVINQSEQAGTSKFIRPIKTNSFLADPKEFEEQFDQMIALFGEIKSGERNFAQPQLNLIDKVIYTTQQALGADFDLLVKPNAARKHAGNRFEELIQFVFTAIGVANKKLVLQIPYETEQGQKVYKCENDLILSPYQEVISTSQMIDKNEVVVSIKTTSKDRMGKMFIDKLLLERFIGHEQKLIGIFLNDVQRKEADNISFTFVYGLYQFSNGVKWCLLS